MGSGGNGGGKRARQEEGGERERERGANHVLLMFLKSREKIRAGSSTDSEAEETERTDACRKRLGHSHYRRTKP